VDIDVGLNAGHVAQMVIALLMVVTAIIAASLFMRRIHGVQSRLGSEFRVISGISLGARERLVLVQVGDKQLLIGVAPGHIQTLYVLDEPLATGGRDGQADALSANTPFARTLRSLVQGKRQ